MGIAEGPLATVAKKLCFSVKFWNDDNNKKEVLKRAEGNRGRGEHGRERKSKPRAPKEWLMREKLGRGKLTAWSGERPRQKGSGGLKENT